LAARDDGVVQPQIAASLIQEPQFNSDIKLVEDSPWDTCL
jgi:hypothetical protein